MAKKLVGAWCALSALVWFSPSSQARSLLDILLGTPDAERILSRDLKEVLEPAQKLCGGQRIVVSAVRSEAAENLSGNIQDVVMRMRINQGACDVSPDFQALATAQIRDRGGLSGDANAIVDAIRKHEEICGVSVVYSVDERTREVSTKMVAYRSDRQGTITQIGLAKLSRIPARSLSAPVRDCLRRPIFTGIENCHQTGGGSHCTAGMINCQARYLQGAGDTRRKSLPIQISPSSLPERPQKDCSSNLTQVVRDYFNGERAPEFKIDGAESVR